MRRLTKAVPDASSPSCFKCPTYGAGELSVSLLSVLEKRSSTLRKRGKGKKTPPRRNDSRYWRDGGANKVSAISKGK